MLYKHGLTIRFLLLWLFLGISNLAKAANDVPVVQLGDTPILAPIILGQTATGSVSVANRGSGALSINFAQSTTTSGFILSPGTCTASIAPSGSCSLTITFSPSFAGVTTGTLLLASNDPVTPIAVVNLGGYAYGGYPVPQIFQINPPTIAIGSGAVNIQVIGCNFFPASVVEVNGVSVKTTYTSFYLLNVTLDASLFATLGELTITASNPGAQSPPTILTLYKSIPFQAADIVYEPVGKLLWASVPSSSTVNPNTLISMDPVTGFWGAPISVGSDPRYLATSDDGQYLYVAANGASEIQRVNLQTLSVERVFSLPATGCKTGVRDLHVVPASPQLVAASLFCPGGSPSELGLALFNDTGLVNWIGNTFSDGNVEVDSFAFAGTPPHIYSLPITLAGNPFFGIFTIDAAGVHKQSTGVSGAFKDVFGLTIASDGTSLYTTGGGVWNPSTQALVGIYESADPTFGFSAANVIPDDTLGRTFFLDWNYSGAQTGALAVYANDQTTFALDGVVPFLTPVVGSVPNAAVQDLARWGSNGFAFLTGINLPTVSKNLVVFTSSIANSIPPPQPPILGSTGVGSVSQGGPAFTLKVTGGHFVNGSTMNWNNTPLPTTVINSQQLNATVPASEIASSGVVFLTVTNPFPNATSSFPEIFLVTPTLQGTFAPNSLSFGQQSLNIASAAQAIALTNSGQSSMTIYAVRADAVNGNFTQTNNCGNSLAAGASCTINVSFQPGSAGTVQGFLTVDAGGNTPLRAALSRTGVIADFAVLPASSGSTAATIQPGQIATYQLAVIAGASYSGTVGLTCTQVPANYSCSLSQSSLQLQPGATGNFTVKLSTAASAVIQATPQPIANVLGMLFALILFSAVWFRLEAVYDSRKVRFAALALSAAVTLGAMISCGGGTSSSSSVPTTAAPVPQTYTLQIVATDGTTTHTLPITLTID